MTPDVYASERGQENDRSDAESNARPERVRTGSRERQVTYPEQRPTCTRQNWVNDSNNDTARQHSNSRHFEGRGEKAEIRTGIRMGNFGLTQRDDRTMAE